MTTTQVDRMRVWKAVAVVLAGLVLVGAALLAARPRGPAESPPPETLLTWPIRLVIRGLVEGDRPGVQFKDNRLTTVAVSEVLWSAGAHVLGGGVVAQFDDPDLGERIEISVPPQFDLAQGREYVFAAGRAWFPEPEIQATWPWQLALALDPSQAYAAVAGTPQGLVVDLGTLRHPGESNLDALMAWLPEFTARSNARNSGRPMPEGPRAAALLAAHNRATDPLVPSLDDFLATPPESRQLSEVLEDLPEGVPQALGFDHWAQWEVTVPFDEAMADKYGWFAIRFPGVGYLGPMGLDAPHLVTFVSGWGPPQAHPQLVLWRSHHAELLGEPEVVDLGVTVGPAERALLDAGGALLVDLRGGITARFLDRAAYDVFLEELIPSAGPQGGS